MIKIRKGLRVYSSRKIVLTEQEKEDYERRIQKQVEKYERDLKCGGIDERVILHACMIDTQNIECICCIRIRFGLVAAF